MLSIQVQDDLFSFEDSGRQSRISWTQSGGRDYLDEELRYMRETELATPSALDPRDLDAPFTPSSDALLMTPGAEDSDAKYIMRMDSRPLADEGMTPGTASDYFSTPVHQRQHPLSDAERPPHMDKSARRALVGHLICIELILYVCMSFINM